MKITSLLTVDDAGAAANGYELVGIPDGIGVARDGNRAIVHMNHELRDTQGIARRHGQPGAFASRLEINRRSLAVTSGSDLVDPGVQFWDYPSGTYVTSGARFADTPSRSSPSADGARPRSPTPASSTASRAGPGYRGQIYFGNEEDGDIGRTFGILTDGTAKALPRLGFPVGEHDPSRQSVPHDGGDGPGGRPGGPVSQLWIYVGTKQNIGDAFDRAGLTNGLDFVLDAVNPAVPPTPSGAPRSVPASRLRSRSTRSRGTSPAPRRTARR